MTKEIFDRELAGFPDYLMPELIEKAREIMRNHGIFAEDKSEDLPVCKEEEVGFQVSSQSNFLRDYLKWREESREMFEEPDYAEFADKFCDSLRENYVYISR
ncbi:MAG: hypothetical protein MJZ66_10035 [Bacteroidales bacterium]|nr:hypothetical protein [Bacteroidales bacterium]